MPRYDQTGPNKEGLGSGRKFGPCFKDKLNNREFLYHDGYRINRQYRFSSLAHSDTGLNWLKSRKTVLEKELDLINQTLQSESK